MVDEPSSSQTERSAQILSDEDLLALWRSVNGSHSELNGPLIRYAGLVARAVTDPKPIEIMDELHRIFAVHMIASRAVEYERLVTHVVSWAAAACRQSKTDEVEKLKTHVETLSARLQKYGQHLPDCALTRHARAKAQGMELVATIIYDHDTETIQQEAVSTVCTCGFSTIFPPPAEKKTP